MRRMLPLPALCLLAACGTPQEQCIARETRDLRVVEQLLAETETNLARGFSLEPVTVWRPVWVDCTRRATRDNPNPRTEFCFDDEPQTVARARAIDPVAETAKRDALVERRRELSRQAERSIEACRAAYPET